MSHQLHYSLHTQSCLARLDTQRACPMYRQVVIMHIRTLSCFRNVPNHVNDGSRPYRAPCNVHYLLYAMPCMYSNWIHTCNKYVWIHNWSMYAPGCEVAEQMRYRVRSETQLTCSVGLGPNTMLAKVASDINKPNGQYALPEEPAVLREFVHSLSLRKVPGIGKVTVPQHALHTPACVCY